MPKKARTPPPPRRVQAPKVRTGRERSSKQPARSLRERVNLWFVGLALAIVVVAGVLIGVLSTKGSSKPVPARLNNGVSLGDMAKLPGAQLGKPPWNRGGKDLQQRLEVLGLTPAGSEALQFHIHQHLDVYVDGKRVSVPPLVGFGLKGQNVQFLAFLHTHDASGIIHVESPTQYDYTLGQFLGVWGVRISKTCIGGLCSSRPLHVWVNGTPFLGDPAKLALTQHEEIVVAFGTPPATIPSHYKFPKGL